MKKYTNIYIASISLLIVFTIVFMPVVQLKDIYISGLIYNFFNITLIITIFSFITNYTLGYIVGPIIVLGYLAYRRDRKNIEYFLVSFISLTAVRFILVDLIHRTRPFIHDTSIHYLTTPAATGYSFPSGHSTQAFFLAYFLTTYIKTSKWKTVGIYTLALLVAISRVYLGAHYVLDVAAGTVLGLWWGIISLKLLRTLRP